MTIAQRVSMLIAGAIVLLSAGCATSPSDADAYEAPASVDLSDDQKRARIRLQLAVNYYEQGQHAVALDELRQAMQADPKMADAYSLRALINMEMGENRLAEENFQQALRLAPNSPDYNNNYGWFLCQTGREKQSIARFEAALKSRAYQSPAKAYNNAGICSLKLNDTKAAEKYFTSAFELDPGNPSTSSNLARIYFDQGDYARARFYAGRVIRADVVTADILWLAIKIERKLGDRATEASFVNQLRRRHPGSAEYAAYQRGSFDE